MPVTDRQRRHLKGLAHHLKPVVIVGQAGVSQAVLDEIGASLDSHELIKVKVNAGDREERQRMIGQITEHTQAQLIDTIGHVIVLFRANPKKKQPLSMPV
jgi:RNA-binding protein